MGSCEQIRPQLSEYVDRALTPDARQAVDQHLRTCSACAGIVEDLRRVTAAASALAPIDPPEHVWIEVAGRVRLDQRHSADGPHPTPVARRSRGVVWQWAGIAASLVVVTFAAYLVVRPTPVKITADVPAPAPASNAATTASVETFAEEMRQAEAHYDAAIKQLEALAKSPDGTLAPAVAQTLQRNLVVIDQAINESRTALDAHPESEPARDSLFEALRRKVSVLQDTVVLMNEMRQGDDAGAAKAANGKSSSS